MTYNSLYRVLIARINNILEQLDITLPVIEFTCNNITIKNFKYSIHNFPLNKVYPAATINPHEIYYYIFSTVLHNIYCIDKLPYTFYKLTLISKYV